MTESILQALQTVFEHMILPDSVAGMVFILIILVFRQLTRHWSKGYVRILWLLLFTGLLMPPFVRVSFHTLRNMDLQGFTTQENMKEQHPQSERMDMQAQSGDMARKEVTAYEGQPGDTKTGQLAGQAQTAAGQHNPASEMTNASVADLFGQRPAPAIMDWCVPVWAAGMLVLLVFYLCQYLTLGYLLKSGSCIPGPDYRISRRISVPFVMPGLPPRIYLPYGLSASQKADILAHERQHVKNLDPLWKCLAMAVSTVYWFHPFVWAAVSLMGKDVEMYCDERVMRGKSLTERRAYSRTLLEFAAKSSGLAITMNFGESNTGRRINHILNMRKPRRTVSALLTLFVCICGILFLTSGNVEGKTDKTPRQTSQKQQESRQPAGTETKSFRKRPEKFAEKIQKLIKNDKKKQLAALIHFPLRVWIDTEETNLERPEDFVNYYDQIVTTEWKEKVLAADSSELFHNYMGYSLGNGSIWFSKISGQKGFWIYALNNQKEPRYKETDDAGKRWEVLAQAEGMSLRQARSWYERFAGDQLAVDQNNEKITGCAYKDFDGNGIMDLFIVTSLDTSDIYPESLAYTMNVYGYLNNRLVYHKGFADEFSKDGFIRCEAQPAQSEPSGVRILYTVDTDRLKEQPYLLEFDQTGNLLSEQHPGESENLIHMLAEIPQESYAAAVTHLENSGQQFMDDHVVLLGEDKQAGIQVYGCESRKYGARGLMIHHNGSWSFADYSWDRAHGQTGFAVLDSDGDGAKEFALVLPYGQGTGVSVYQLILFQYGADGTLMDYALTEEMMKEQTGRLIRVDREQETISILRDGKIRQQIPLKDYPCYREDADQVNVYVMDQISFAVENGTITMTVQAGVFFGATQITPDYIQGTGGTVSFDVRFGNGQFQIY